MNTDYHQLLSEPRSELVNIVQADNELLTAIYQAFPESSEHVGYELFDEKWVRTYGRQILRAIGHIKDVQSWSWTETTLVGLAIDAIANDLLRYLGLPSTSTYAVVALTILLIKGFSEKQ